MKEAVIVDACRTAFGKARPGGMFFNTRAEDLSIAVVKAVVERNPRMNVEEIEDLRWGCSAAQHEQGSNLARRLVLMSGLPRSVGGCTMIRYCASSLESIASAAHAINFNAGEIFIAGGVEHQSAWDYEWFANGHYPDFYKVCHCDPAMDNMGITAENILEMVGLIGQEDVIGDLLSHGDKKRLELAITLGNRPELLLMDEPTAGMGPEETWAIVDLIQKLNKDENLTILFTEHDMDVIFDIADRVSVLHQGRLIFEGLPEEVQRNDSVKDCYLGNTSTVIDRAD